MSYESMLHAVMVVPVVDFVIEMSPVASMTLMFVVELLFAGFTSERYPSIVAVLGTIVPDANGPPT